MPKTSHMNNLGRARAAFALACTLGFALVAIPEAGAHVYWTNNTTNTIGRANLDGSVPNQSFIAAANFPYGVALTPASEPAGFDCAIDGQAFVACGSPKSYSGLADGPHSLGVRAHDSAGNVDPTPASRSWSVADTTKPSVADTTKPRLTALKLSRSRFAAAASGPSISKAKAKKDTKVSYTLSEPPTVRFTVQRRKAGRLVNGKCRTRTSKNRRRTTCDLPLKSSAKQGAAGKNSLRFRGRLSGRKLKRGSYQLVATATDAAGHRSTRKKSSSRLSRPEGPSATSRLRVRAGLQLLRAAVQRGSRRPASSGSACS